MVGVNTDHLDDETLTLEPGHRRLQRAARTSPRTPAPASCSWPAATSRAPRAPPTTTAASTARCSPPRGAPVVLHWLGTAFDPSLAGYFGSTDTDAASETLLEIIGYNRDRVAGVKMSLLDADAEIAVRAKLPTGTPHVHRRRLQLRRPDRGRRVQHSDALLGAFAALAPQASAAHPGARPRRHRRVPPHPRAHRGPLAPGLRRAHLLLQDRRRVPQLAERPPGRLQHGRRPARGPQPAAPLRDRAARERRRRPRAPGARRRPLARPAGAERHRRVGALQPGPPNAATPAEAAAAEALA